MHVRTIFSPSTEAGDIELAEFLLLGQLNVMTEVAMFPLLIINEIIIMVVTPTIKDKLYILVMLLLIQCS